MSTVNNSLKQKRRPTEIKIELQKQIEDKISFQERRDQVQILLTDMFLRLKKRGRPNSTEEEDQYAA